MILIVLANKDNYLLETINLATWKNRSEETTLSSIIIIIIIIYNTSCACSGVHIHILDQIRNLLLIYPTLLHIGILQLEWQASGEKQEFLNTQGQTD